MARYLSFRDGGKTDEEGIARYISKFLAGEVLTGLEVSQQSPVALGITVGDGDCMVPSGNDYPYIGWNDANLNISLATADGSNPRYDLIVAYVDLAIVQSVTPNNPNAFVIDNVTGTPAGSPVEPNLSAIEAVIGVGNPYIILARITVGAGVTNITNSNIIDRRNLVNLSVSTNQTVAGEWNEAGETWVYASASTFTIAGVDVRDKYPIGTKIKLTQSSTKYFTVIATAFSTNTTITIQGAEDYTLANAAITNPYYSYAQTPKALPASLGGWREVARKRLTVAGNTISVTGIPAAKYYRIHAHAIATGGTIDSGVRFNNDSGSNYIMYQESNTLAGASSTAIANVPIEAGATDSGGLSVWTMDIFNIATGTEKSYMQRGVSHDAAGAANIPTTIGNYGKWANTSALINRIDWINLLGTGNFAIGSQIVVEAYDLL